MRFYRNDAIEELAEERLRDLAEALGRAPGVPVAIDLLGELVLGLSFLWDEIEELPGETIFGGIVPKKRLILLNERHRSLFRVKPGLVRSTKGHEMGHWDLFVDEAHLDHPDLFDVTEGRFTALRNSPQGDVSVLLRTPMGQKLVREINKRADDPDEARAVNRYAAAISMPHQLMALEMAKMATLSWPDLYRLAERFDVTISALRVRLEQLDLLYVTEDKSLYRSRAEALGQRPLF